MPRSLSATGLLGCLANLEEQPLGLSRIGCQAKPADAGQRLQRARVRCQCSSKAGVRLSVPAQGGQGIALAD